MLESILQDLRHGVRQARRSPGFTLIATLTLALGIGAITTVFTWANAVLFNPWPQVNKVREIRSFEATVHGNNGYSLSYPEYEYLSKNSNSFYAITAHELLPVDVTAPGVRPETVWSGIVASNYFNILGMQPELGRFFTLHGDRAYGSRPEVVISDGMWRSRFHADPAVLGQTLQLNHQLLTIVGVAPKGFVGIYGGMAQSLWLPLSMIPALTDGEPAPLDKGFGLQVVARLRPGVKDEQAAAELHTLARQFADAQKSTNYNGWDLNLTDTAHMPRGMYGSVGEAMPILLVAAVLLLVLVCANVAGLLIQRGTRRAREIAIRTTLGATRGRIAQRLLAETAVLALIAGVLGWLASLGLSRTLYVLLPQLGMPFVFNLQPDASVLVFAMAVTGVVVLASGLLPARLALSMSQTQALHEGAVSVLGARGGWRRTALLSVQMGICFVVLLSCGLLLRTLVNVMHRDPGFETRNTLVASLDLTRAGYSAEKGLQFESALLERLRNAPGVESATLTTYVPMGNSGGGNTRSLAIEGYEPAKDESMNIVTDAVGPEYFRTLRIPLAKGREFSPQDDGDAPLVAVVNDDMARQYWPHGNAVGSRVQVGKRWLEVVGVSRHIIYRSAANDGPDPVLYVPLLQNYDGGISVVVRARASAYSVLPSLQQAVASLNATLPLNDIESLSEHVQTSYFGQRMPAEMIGVYAICSLLVALLGIYAAMAYAVTERYKEFGLRVALGGPRKHIFGLVLQTGAQAAAGGLLAGAVGGFFAVRLLRSALYGVSPFDFMSALAAGLLLVVTALGACWLPARSATQVDPMRALRSE